MKALSFKQPWAWLVATGIKDVENRTWWLHMPPFLNYPADPRRIYVHASKNFDLKGLYWLTDNNEPRPIDAFPDAYEVLMEKEPEEYALGAIIGEVDIVACFHESQIGYPGTKSPWFTGTYGLVLKNAELYDKPIPYKGNLGFFEVADLKQ